MSRVRRIVGVGVFCFRSVVSARFLWRLRVSFAFRSRLRSRLGSVDICSSASFLCVPLALLVPFRFGLIDTFHTSFSYLRRRSVRRAVSVSFASIYVLYACLSTFSVHLVHLPSQLKSRTLHRKQREQEDLSDS